MVQPQNRKGRIENTIEMDTSGNKNVNSQNLLAQNIHELWGKNSNNRNRGRSVSAQRSGKYFQ